MVLACPGDALFARLPAGCFARIPVFRKEARMRSSRAIILFALAMPLLNSCGQKEPAIDVDPQIGQDCFDSHVASLPNGTQYEGIERAVAGQVTIRVMTGVALTTVECALAPDGTLRSVEN